jgi:hypothetical protein
MPKTFQEAILVSRELRIRYLWIDSLCIMQDRDDLSDWAREASLMYKVYSNSYCNISAPDSSDGTHGLGRDCTTLELEPERIEIRHENASGSMVTKVYNAEKSSSWQPGLWRIHVENNVVNKRGWVFQERLLAPQVLHFAASQLFWECRELSACEKYPKGASIDCLPSSRFKHDLAFETYSELDSIRIHWKWRNIVTQYTSTSVTNPNNKLVAISNIVKSVALIVRDTYIAGMWRKNLEMQLL